VCLWPRESEYLGLVCLYNDSIGEFGQYYICRLDVVVWLCVWDVLCGDEVPPVMCARGLEWSEVFK
jgi:hypothetical protein